MATLRGAVFLLLLQAHGGVEAGAREEITGRVGDMCDVSRVSFEGQRAFTDAEIRRALQVDLSYLVASHPASPLGECLSVLEERVRAGYRAAGFGDVVVSARIDDSAGRIVARIAEGPCYRCGALEVVGLRSIPAGLFQRRLAEQLQSPAGSGGSVSGRWSNGAPVSFTAESLSGYATAVSNVFTSLGRFIPKYEVEVRAEPGTIDAGLVVTVQDEGRAAVLDEVELVGGHKNSREAVMTFLDLSKGMSITQELVDAKVRSLRQAARFADASITPVRIEPDGRVSLRIQVVEAERLPALEEPLSREARAMVRLCDWLTGWESRKEDLVVDWSLPTAQGMGPRRIQFVVDPSRGIVARMTAGGTGQVQDVFSVLLATGSVGLYAPVHERKLLIPLRAGYGGVIAVKMASCTNCPSGFSLNLSAGFSQVRTNAGWRVDLDLLPAALADLLCRPETKTTWEGAVLTVRTEDLRVRLVEETGQLLELAVLDGSPGSGSDSREGIRFLIRFSSGAFGQAVEQIESDTRTHADAFQSRRALGSTLGFVAAEVVRAQPFWGTGHNEAAIESQAALASALETLLSGSFLDPVQGLLDESTAHRSDREFLLPPETGPAPAGGGLMSENLAVISTWCAGHARELVPAGSWLEILFREWMLALNSRSQFRSAEFARLAEYGNPGPLGCDVALHGATRAGSGSPVAFSGLGLRRLATEDFRRDYRMLLGPDSVVTRCLANLARELGALRPAQVEALAGFLPPGGRSTFRELAAAAADAKARPVAEAVGPALDRWWESNGKSQLEADFRYHAGAWTPPRLKP